MGNLIAMIFQTQSSEVYRTYCNPYITFCIFSESRASSLDESQSICTEINANSWPAELSDVKIHQVFHEYIHNYSLHNVILNAEKVGEAWFWIKAVKEVGGDENITAEDDLLVYNRDPAVSNYWVVCMIDCKSTWMDFTNTATNLPRLRPATTHTLHECKDECEEADDCSSVSMVPIFVVTECWLFGYPYDPDQVEHRTGSHHVIDRSGKTVERCIGDYEGKKTEMSSTLVLIMIGLGTLFVLILLLVFCFICCESALKSYTTESSAASS